MDAGPASIEGRNGAGGRVAAGVFRTRDVPPPAADKGKPLAKQWPLRPRPGLY